MNPINCGTIFFLDSLKQNPLYILLHNYFTGILTVKVAKQQRNHYHLAFDQRQRIASMSRRSLANMRQAGQRDTSPSIAHVLKPSVSAL